jgi:hypothetical protein
MTYKRGGVYWYKFRWTLKLQDGARTISCESRPAPPDHRPNVRM